MKCELIVAKGPNAEERCAIAEGQQALLGRSEDCDLRLRDPSVSRHQCLLRLEANRLLFSDLSSRWGTLVNGQLLKAGELKSGDRLTLGDTEIVVLLGSSPDDITVPPRSRPALDQSPTDEFPRPTVSETFPNSPSVGIPLSPDSFRGDSGPGEPKGVSPRTNKSLATALKSSIYRLATSDDHQIETKLAEPKTDLPPPIVDRQFGKLKLETVVAIGRTGIVYSSLNAETGEKLAVKLFYPEVLPEGEPRDRFVRAMRTMIDLRHENLVRLHRAGSQRGVCYTVSEFIEGQSAAQMLAIAGGTGLDWRAVRHIARGVASALQFAFQKNLVHRNVTPSNILIQSGDQVVKLGDLSLAKALIGANAFDVTRTNNLIGQLSYLSPEQIEHSPNQNHQSDLYSLGATLYELLTGRLPFQGESASDLMRQILSSDPRSIRETRPDVPAELEAIILRLLAKNPQNRFATPMELWTRLAAET